MLETLERADLPWRVALESNSPAGVLAAVRAGLDVATLMPVTVIAPLSFSSAPCLSRGAAVSSQVYGPLGASSPSKRLPSHAAVSAALPGVQCADDGAASGG